MSWRRYHIRTESITWRWYDVKAQSPEHARKLLQADLDRGSDRFPLVDISETEEEVRS